jgi:hypothetical protein
MSLKVGIGDLNCVIRRILGEDWQDITDEEVEVMKQELKQREPVTVKQSCLLQVGGSEPMNSLGSRSDEGRESAVYTARPEPPYPWCHGNPTIKDCIEAGYCRRDPSCGD